MRAELGLDEGTFVVGAVARLDPVKSLETLIQAVASFEAPARVVALIVGDGPERAALERAAKESRAPERIRFLGYRPDARRCLAACDTYVNCSTSEGVSLTILEAMAAALPVIVTAVGGTPEVVTPECGLLIPPRDPAALAAAIRALQADPAAARIRGLTGRARVERVFSIDRMVADYADVYRAVS
jgi:glycosyltransferase involved in cell wall biosynthesis